MLLKGPSASFAGFVVDDGVLQQTRASRARAAPLLKIILADGSCERFDVAIFGARAASLSRRGEIRRGSVLIVIDAVLSSFRGVLGASAQAHTGLRAETVHGFLRLPRDSFAVPLLSLCSFLRARMQDDHPESNRPASSLSPAPIDLVPSQHQIHAEHLRRYVDEQRSIVDVSPDEQVVLQNGLFRLRGVYVHRIDLSRPIATCCLACRQPAAIDSNRILQCAQRCGAAIASFGVLLPELTLTIVRRERREAIRMQMREHDSNENFHFDPPGGTRGDVAAMAAPLSDLLPVAFRLQLLLLALVDCRTPVDVVVSAEAAGPSLAVRRVEASKVTLM